LTQPPVRRLKRVRVKREATAPPPANGEALAVKQPSPLAAKASLLAGKLAPTRAAKKAPPVAARLPSNPPATG
jgi:hypothetical protein